MALKKIVREIYLKAIPNYRHRKLSYAQYGEDQLIYRLFREYLGIDSPSYIDIGAHHPFHLSNTGLLYKLGCRGWNIEANPDLIKAFEKYRPEDQNLNIGISTDKNAVLPFYVMKQQELNTFFKERAESLAKKGYGISKVINIQCHNLDYIISNYCNGTFPDFLSLDVEGMDESIIESYDFTTTRPKIICVENLEQNEAGVFCKNENIRKKLKTDNYQLIADTFLNDIFVDGNLLKVQTN